MNKKLEELFKGYGLDIIGKQAYGVMDGYEVNVAYKTQIFLHISFYASDEVKRQIAKELRDLKISFFKFQFSAFGLLIAKNDWTTGTFIKKFPDFICKVMDVLKKNQVFGITHCPVCGDEIDYETCHKYESAWCKIALDEKCAETINNQIAAENEEFDNAPNNYFKGTLGAILGAFVGIIVLIILFYIGVVSSLSVIVAIGLGSFFYKHFGGKPNKGMLAIVTSISVIAMFLAIFLLYYRAANLLANEYGFSSTGMKAFTDMMTVAEFSSEFTINMLLTALFSAIGAGVQGFSMFKSLKREKPMK